MFVTAKEANIVEAGVIQAKLVLLHLGFNAADSSPHTVLAPVAVLPPAHAGSLQHWIAAAAELDVVDGRVVSERALVGLHAQLEGGEHAAGAVLRVGPLTEAEDACRRMKSKTGQSLGQSTAAIETRAESYNISEQNVAFLTLFLSPDLNKISK